MLFYFKRRRKIQKAEGVHENRSSQTSENTWHLFQRVIGYLMNPVSKLGKYATAYNKVYITQLYDRYYIYNFIYS